MMISWSTTIQPISRLTTIQIKYLVLNQNWRKSHELVKQYREKNLVYILDSDLVYSCDQYME